MKHLYTFIFFNILNLSVAHAQATFLKTISTSSETNQTISPGVEFNGYYYFTSGTSTTFGSTMWKTNGTSSGTKEFVYSNDVFNPTPIFVFKNELYYFANTIEGQKYYKTDGTTSTLFLEPTEDAPIVSFDNRTSVILDDNHFVFTHGTAATGFELYISDGTADNNPTLVKDINPGINNSSPFYFNKIASNKVVFRADDGTHGRELWVTDGTSVGTHLVKDINPNGNATINGLTSFNGKAYFQSENGIWETDGTEAGTVIFLNLRGSDNSEYPFHIFNGNMYFTAYDATFNKVDLWKTDGTIAGSSILASGLNLFNAFQGTNNLLFFTAEDDVHGEELWRTDGTVSGTYLTKDIIPGPESGMATFQTDYDLGNGGDKLFFQAIFRDENGDFDENLSRELWSSDGTESGTILNTKINTGSQSFGSNPQDFFNIRDKLFFKASVENSGIGTNQGIHLWVVDANVLSVSENENPQTNFFLYPNPSSNVVAIKDKNKTIKQVDIFSIDGRKIKTISSNFQSISVQDLYAGTYIMNIQLKDGKHSNLKFLKQ